MAVAMLSLFVALGSSAYAAKKIGSNQIKANAITAGKIMNNAVTAAKLRNNAVATAKIKDGAVTGAKISEGTLGTVPAATTATTAAFATSAANAAQATHATNATNAATATSFSRYFTSGLVTTTVGSPVEVAAVGPFKIGGSCSDEGGGNFKANLRLSTSQEDSFMFSPQSEGFVNGGFDPGDEAFLGDVAIDTIFEWHGTNGLNTEWFAASPDGAFLLQGYANMGVHAFGADCAFLVTWTNDA
jgi:hypothetical protein